MKKRHSIGSVWVILFVSITTFGQTHQNLSKQLWERVQNCYSQFKDKDGDGKLDEVEIIDDSRNEYLKFARTIGTCDCTC